MIRPERKPGRIGRGWLVVPATLAALLAAQVASALGATQVYTGGSSSATPDIGRGGIELFYPDGRPVTIDGNVVSTINFTVDGTPYVGYCVDTTRLFSEGPEAVALTTGNATPQDRAIAWILANRTPTGTPTADKALEAAAAQVAIWLLRNQVSQTTPTDDAEVNAAAFALRDEALAATATPATLEVSASTPAGGGRESVITVSGRPGAVVTLTVTSGSGTFSAGTVTLGPSGTGQVTLSTSAAGPVTVSATTAGDPVLTQITPLDPRDQATAVAAAGTLSAQATVTFTQASTPTGGTTTTPGGGTVTTPVPGGGTPGGVVTQTPRARLVLTKVGPRTGRGGQVVRYVIRVTNRGRGIARDVRVTDRIPGGLGVTQRNFTSLRNGSAVWSLGTLAPGRSRTITVSLRAALRLSGTRTNVALASATGLTPVSARAVTTFTPAARRVQPAVTG